MSRTLRQTVSIEDLRMRTEEVLTEATIRPIGVRRGNGGEVVLVPAEEYFSLVETFDRFLKETTEGAALTKKLCSPIQSTNPRSPERC